MLRVLFLIFPLLASATAMGPNLPPAGRSLFDKLFLENGAYRIPFPFSVLVENLQSKIDHSSRPLQGVKGAILPLGRSLQRKAGYPEVYRFPRVVIALDGELRAPLSPDTRDKLFIGFHEKASVLEVISYNEEAGRFEFQVVHGYEAGKQPKVLYSNRGTCIACHQNQAPLFAEAPWDETQANAAVSAKLQQIHGARYQGVPTSSTQDTPYDFDAAKARANMLSVYQRGWQELCGDERCRREVFQAALEMRLNGLDHFPLSHVKGSWEKRWKKFGAKGLPIPNGVIPNRDPLFQKESLENLLEVESEFEPLNLRAPQEFWSYETTNVERVFSGLAHLFTDAEMRDLRPRLEGKELGKLVAKIPRKLFRERPFPKRELLNALYKTQGWSFPAQAWEQGRLPPIEIDVGDASVKTFARDSELGTFRRCAACHNNTIGVPPNFLYGELSLIRKNLAHCSERIFYRLAMWDRDPGVRKKTPMPPVTALELTEDEWVHSGELRKIRDFVGKELKRRQVDVKALLRKDFSALPGCLAE